MTLLRACALSAIIASPAYAEVCSDKLLEKDFLTGSSSRDQRLFDYSLACSSTFKEYDQAKGGNAEASFKLLGGGATYNESTYESFKSKNCGTATKDQYRSSMSFYGQKILSKEAIDGYVQCMKNAKEGFNCWAEPKGQRNISFIVYRSPLSAEVVSKAGAMVDGNVTPIDNSLGKNSRIKIGTQSLAVHRNDNKSVYFTINLSNQIVSHTCNAYVMEEPDIPKGPKCFVTYNTNTDFDGDGCFDKATHNRAYA